MKEKFIEFVRKYPRTLAGFGGGFLCAVLLLTLGFWRTLLLAALCALGGYLGSQADRGVKLTELLYRAWIKLKILFGPR